MEIIIIIICILVILQKNEINAILYLALLYMGTTILFISKGLESLGYLILIIYLGAIVVLFVFVIFMLKLKTNKKSKLAIFVLPFPILYILTNGVKEGEYSMKTDPLNQLGVSLASLEGLEILIGSGMILFLALYISISLTYKNPYWNKFESNKQEGELIG